MKQLELTIEPNTSHAAEIIDLEMIPYRIEGNSLWIYTPTKATLRIADPLGKTIYRGTPIEKEWTSIPIKRQGWMILNLQTDNKLITEKIFF